MRVVFLLLLLLLPLPLSVHAEDLGKLSANPFNPDSTSNPFGAGSPFKPDCLNNPFSPYGSPYATDAPRLYDQQGNYRGKLSANPYDPDSTSNPYGRYGSPFSPDSINNPFGAGNPYSPSKSLRPRPANRRTLGSRCYLRSFARKSAKEIMVMSAWC